MKNKILYSVLVGFILLVVSPGIAQDYDLIVTTKGDSIACRIDSISKTQIYFEMKSQNNWAHTHISLKDVLEYNRNAIHRDHFVYKTGTSIIEYSVQEPITSYEDMDKNSVYVGILSANYSRLISRDSLGISIAGGVNLVTSAYGEKALFMIETTWLTGGKKHIFEPGLLAYFNADVILPMIRIGYRYQNPKGFLFRAAPLLGFYEGFTVMPSISLGFSF